MALRSLLSIDVDDGAFGSYKRAFDAYEAAVKKLPADWAKTGAAIEGSRKSFEALVAKMTAQNAQAAQYALAQKAADALTRSQADSWKQMSGFTKDVVGNLIRTTENLIKWVGPIAIITGLLGAAGGLFGLDRLAISVAGGRRSALGLGVSYGQQNAFALNFGRFVDPGAMLGNVSAGLYNMTSDQYRGLLGAGLSSAYLANPKNSAADVSVELLKSLPGIFESAHGDRGLIGTIAEKRGLNSILSTEDIVRYLRASPAERAAQEQSYRKDVGTLDVSPQNQLAYTNFITQLERAGQQIEAVFARGLVGLAKPIEDLSKAFAKWVAIFLDSPALKGWIDELRKGIDWLAKQMSSPEFEGNVTAFVHGLEEFIKQIRGWVDWFVAKYHLATDIYGAATGAPTGTSEPGPVVVPPPPGVAPGSNIAPNRDRLEAGRRPHAAGSHFVPQIFGVGQTGPRRGGPAGARAGAGGFSPPAVVAPRGPAAPEPSPLGDEFLARPKPLAEGQAVTGADLHTFVQGLDSLHHDFASNRRLMRPHAPYQHAGTRPHVEISPPTGGQTVINNLTAAN